MGRQPRGHTGVCKGQETDPGRVEEGRVLRQEALAERAFVVKWASRGGSRWSERRGVFLPRAEGRDGSPG